MGIMKIAKFLTILFVFTGLFTFAQPSVSDTLLRYYQQYPQEAIKDAEREYQKALATNNIPELLQAIIQKAHFTLQINDTKYPEVIQELEKSLTTQNNLTAQSILHSYIGQLYNTYYQNNYWIISQRNLLDGEIPQKMEEWSSNIFQEKILQHFKASVASAEVLQQTPLSSFRLILIAGSADSLRPTLYDLLSYRAIDLLKNKSYFFPSSSNQQPEILERAEIFMNLPILLKTNNIQSYILQFWQGLLRFHTHSPYPDALLLANLDRLNYARQISRLPQKDSLYLNTLQQMQKEYTGNEMVVEILANKARALLSNRYSIQPVHHHPDGQLSHSRDVIQQALNICEEGIRQYPHYRRINLLHKIIQEIKTPELSVSFSEMIYPGDSLPIHITYKNIRNVKLKIFRLNTSSEHYWNTLSDEKQNQIPQTLIYQKNLLFPEELAQQDSLFSIPISKTGLYKVIITTPDSKQNISNVFLCSQLFTTVQALHPKQYSFLVRDWKSGKPIRNAKVLLYSPKYPHYIVSDSAYSNSAGIANFTSSPLRSNFYYQVVDEKNPNGYFLSGYRTFQNESSASFTTLITDRKIYRPGQTVYFQGISWQETPDTLYPLQNKKTTITFRDSQGKIIAEQKTVTDAFGSFTGHFVIPTQIMNGNFRLTTEQGQTSIIVAEYKRPEFYITLDAPQRLYQPGDTVCIKGKALSFTGIATANQEVVYEIIPHIPFSRFSTSNEKIQGFTQTDPSGEFTIGFPIAKHIPATNIYRSLSYQVNVKATDPKGETQEKTIYIPIYADKTKPAIHIPEQVNKEVPTPFIIQLQNRPPSGKSVTVVYTISKLKSPGSVSIDPFRRDTLIESIVSTGKLQIHQKDSITPNLGKQSSGAYLFTVKNGDLESKQIFYLYSLQDKRPPIPTYAWIVKEKTQCYAGETARILLGTSAKNVYVTYEIFSAQKLLKRANPVLSDEIIPIDIPYRAEYGNQIWLLINYVKDKNYIQEIIPIQRLRDNRSLSIQTAVFRDKLQPGEQEEWHIRILNDRNQPALAQALAYMYDASLDQFQENKIYFNPGYLPQEFNRYWQSSFLYNNQTSGSIWNFKQKKYTVPPFKFGSLNTFQTNAVEELCSFAEYGSAPVAGSKLTSQKNIASTRSSLADKATGTNSAGEQHPPIEYRENFQETAFFYPQLQTDSNGYINLRFKMPQALTRWKFTLLAYTPELAYAELVRTITTSQPFMVRPNLPRFFRSGDRAVVKTIISNLSETPQKGTAQLELFNPQGQQILLKRNVPFHVAAGASKTVSFELQIPENIDLLGCRISAITPSFSDGEQHLIAILPDETLITETLPIYTSEAGSHTFSLTNTSSTRKDYRLTLELTANPVWYAVQALPGLAEPRQDNITDISASYYVNTLAARIARSNPAILSAIRQWNAKKNDPTLLSQLERNSELKSILLEATPWMLEAQDETERIQNLIQLFDENRLQYLQNQALQKLINLQTPEGGWSWFKGMPANRFMTVNVLTGMARCVSLGEQQYGNEEKQMQIKALRYLDNELRRDSTLHPKEIGYSQILYLYCRSLYRDIPLGDALDSHKHFMALAQKKWGSFSLYEKALLAVAFQNYGFVQDARNILKSLQQYSETTPDQGMFWPNNRNTFRNSAVLEHTAIMEAFFEIEGNTPALNLMKQWLLRQKQVQNWGSVPATVNAIYVLLLTGNELLDQEDHPTVTLGDHPVAIPDTTNPLGYLKITYPAGEIQPDMLNVKINKEKNTPSWGGLYLQYFEKLSQVKKNQNILSVDKKLFLEKTNSEGKTVIQPIEKQPLKTGDKIIVRLTLSVNRNMEYLHLKDLRAGCFEPVNQLSGNHWEFGTVYYQEVKDAVTNFFFQALPRGTYVIEYPVRITQAGKYQDGIATLQSLYAPEYNAFSTAEEVEIKD